MAFFRAPAGIKLKSIYLAKYLGSLEGTKNYSYLGIWYMHKSTEKDFPKY